MEVNPGRPRTGRERPDHGRTPAIRHHILAGGDLQAEDLPVAVAVDSGRQQGVHVHPGRPRGTFSTNASAATKRCTARRPTGASESLNLRVEVAAISDTCDLTAG